MARRRTRKGTRRSTPKTLNVAGVLEAGLIANAVTTGMFNADLKTFFFNTEGGTSNRAANLNQITIREIIAGVTGTGDGFGTTTRMDTTRPGSGTTYQTIGTGFGETIKQNLQENGAQMLGSLILIPVGFKVVSKLTRKPRAIANKASKMAGLPVRV